MKKGVGLFLIGGLALFLTGIETPLRGVQKWNISTRKDVADNGLTWIFQKDDSSKISSVVLLIQGGQSAVPPGKSGLAFLTTRLAVEIPDEGKLRNLMSQATQLTAQADEDFSLIGIQCLSQNLEDALNIVTRIIKAPLFSSLRIDAIKKNMIHLGRADRDDSVKAAHFEALKAFFGPEGIGGLIWGTEESLKSIQKKDIVNFFESRFTASNMFLSVVSDQEESVLKDLIRKYFSGIECGSSAGAAPAEFIGPQSQPIFIEKDVHQSYVGFAFPLPSLSARHYALTYLAEDILGGGVGSRMWPLRDKEKLAYNVNSFFTYSRGNGILEAYLETSTEKVDLARESLRQVIRELADKGVTSDELSISQNGACASFLRVHEAKESRARALAEFEALGIGFDFLERFSQEIQSIGVDELNAFLKNIFSAEKPFEIVIGPRR